MQLYNYVLKMGRATPRAKAPPNYLNTVPKIAVRNAFKRSKGDITGTFIPLNVTADDRSYSVRAFNNYLGLRKASGSSTVQNGRYQETSSAF